MIDKKWILIIFILIAFKENLKLLAQISYSMPKDSAGVYLTYGDFKSGKLRNGFMPYKHNYFLWPRGFFKYKDINLITPDTSIVYRRTDIWGYTDHQGRLIRVFSNRHFKVLCDKGIVIYLTYSPTSLSYYFSLTLNDPIYRLTRRNLSMVFSNNPDLLKRLNFINKKYWLIWNEREECYMLNQVVLKTDYVNEGY